MTSLIVGHRVFKKPFSELYIGSSVVAGNSDSVRDRETREKGTPFEKPLYLPVDHLTLIEVYKGFLVNSNVAPNAVYEILYDALNGEVKGILCGVKEEEGTAYYALVKRGAKSVKKQIAFYIDYVDFALLPALQKEIEETFSYDEAKIKEVYGNPPERVYAGSFLGSTKEGLLLIPFSTYKAKEVIPAYAGEEDERIPQLELELEELNASLSQLDRESEEYKKLSERRKEVHRELAKLRNQLYNPDLLRAVKSKGERLFITQKPEIRYLGENLLQTAYEYKAITLGKEKRVKGVYAVLTLPVYNNLSGQLQKSYLELFLCLWADGELYPAEIQKARQTVSLLDEAVKELIRSLEAGTKPNLTPIKEKVKENLSLRKRIEDIEKFALSKIGAQPEEVEGLLSFLKEVKEELEAGKRILYSPFTVNKLINSYEVASLLQESGIDLKKLGKSGWSSLYETTDLLNENLENTFKNEFSQEVELLTKFFLKRLNENKPIHYKIRVRGQLEEGFYPAPDRGLDITDLFPNRVLLNLIKGALKKLNAYSKLQKLEETELFFEGATARLGSLALVVFVRKVFVSVAKELLKSTDYNRENEIKVLKELLIQNFKGEFVKRETEQAQQQEGDVVEIEGLDDLLEGSF